MPHSRAWRGQTEAALWLSQQAAGNGRHARLAADALAVELGQPRFTWGSASLVEAAETRQACVRAFQAADDHDMAPLLAFGRS